MKKRSAPSSTGAARPAKNRRPQPQQQGDELSSVSQKMAAKEWFQDVCGRIDSLLDEFGCPTKALDAMIKDKNKWKQFLERNFPPSPAADYMMDSWGDVPGIRNFQLWQTSWAINSGLAGHVVHEKFKELCKSILVQGLLSDPMTPGVELMVIQPSDSDSDVGISSIGFVKGWRRCMAASFVLFVLMDLNMVEPYKEVATQDMISSFGLVRGNFMRIDPHRAIEVSRGWASEPARAWLG